MTEEKEFLRRYRSTRPVRDRVARLGALLGCYEYQASAEKRREIMKALNEAFTFLQLEWYSFDSRELVANLEREDVVYDEYDEGREN